MITWSLRTPDGHIIELDAKSFDEAVELVSIDYSEYDECQIIEEIWEKVVSVPFIYKRK